MRRMEQAHIERAVLAERRPHFTAKARGRHPVGAELDQICAPRDIAARRRNAAARIFNERARDQIGAHGKRLTFLHKLTIAVIHHHDHIRLDRLDGPHNLADLPNAQAWPQGIAARALDIDHFGARINRCANGGEIRQAILPQLRLAVADAKIFQRALPLPAQADHRMDRIVGRARCAEHRIARAQHAIERHRQRVRPASEGVAHECILCAHHIGENPV